ncbi:Rsp5p-dependent ubiquitination, sorting of cargo proteins at the multivesicular body [Allomyces arbusculus]|nr:Rsp5p-dependent ubiquitination, sorting of cargo proteins at the multivesicular body [Allomyces arbusculus]
MFKTTPRPRSGSARRSLARRAPPRRLRQLLLALAAVLVVLALIVPAGAVPKGGGGGGKGGSSSSSSSSKGGSSSSSSGSSSSKSGSSSTGSTSKSGSSSSSSRYYGSPSYPIVGPMGYYGYWGPVYYVPVSGSSSRIRNCTFIRTNPDGSTNTTTYYTGNTCPDPDGGGLSGGAIAGIVIGSIVGLCCCCGLGYWAATAMGCMCCHAIKKNKEKKKNKNKWESLSNPPHESDVPEVVEEVDNAPRIEVTAQGSLANPVHEASADANERGAEFVRLNPPLTIVWSPEYVAQLMDKAQTAKIVVPADATSKVRVDNGEMSKIVFFPDLAVPSAPIMPAELDKKDKFALESDQMMAASSSATMAPLAVPPAVVGPHMSVTDPDVTVFTAFPLPWLPANLPNAPANTRAVVYFEVSIKSMDPHATLAIGLTHYPYPSFRLPGWHPWSIGYHSDDGRLFVSDSDRGREYGKPYRAGDVVGVGVDTRTCNVFFTRNGVKLPDITDAQVPAPFVGIHPAIGADGACEVDVRWHGGFRWADADAKGFAYSLDDAVPAYPAVMPPPPPMAMPSAPTSFPDAPSPQPGEPALPAYTTFARGTAPADPAATVMAPISAPRSSTPAAAAVPTTTAPPATTTTAPPPAATTTTTPLP